MASVGGFAELIGNPLGEAAAFAGGLAVHPLLRPIVQKLENETWSLYADKPTPPEIAARLKAQQNGNDALNQSEAALSGYGQAAFDAMVEAETKAPGTAEALELWRRGKITQDQAVHALKKAQIDPQYHSAILELYNERLDPAAIAVMIQRSVLPNPGILPNQPSSAGSNVPPMPQVDIDPVAEALAHGIDTPRLEALARIIGLPASPDLAARMNFRGIITEGAFNQAILEGNTRGEWAPFLLDGFREILTANQYAELELRGFYDRTTRLANTGKWGMSDADSDLLYDVLGRAPAVHLVVQGLARGGGYPGSYTNVPEPYKSAIQRSNIREEWSEIVYAARYSYPSAFVLRALTQAGDITGAQAEQVLLYEGWEPTFAHQVATSWAGGSASGTQKKETEAHLAAEYEAGHIDQATFTTGLTALGYDATQAANAIQLADFRATKKYRDKAIDSVAKRYIGLQLTDAEATAALQSLGVPVSAITVYLRDWALERDDAGTTLSKSQVKKAYAKSLIVQADALARLGDLGMSPADASTYLSE